MFRLRAGPNAQTVKLPPQHEGELGAPFARSTIVAIGALTYLPRGSLIWGGSAKGSELGLATRASYVRVECPREGVPVVW